MNKFVLNYSLKNIPVGNKQAYMTKLYDMTAKFINRLRWKAYWYSTDDSDRNEDCDDEAAFKFPSRNSAPLCPELSAFEDELYDVIKNIKFRAYDNEFQHRLQQDVKNIKKSKNLLILADKTTNIYEVPKEEHGQLIKKAINRDYKKAPANALDKINQEAHELLLKNNVKGKVPKYEKKEAFITIKDHKTGFPAKDSTRLISPSKRTLEKFPK